MKNKSNEPTPQSQQQTSTPSTPDQTIADIAKGLVWGDRNKAYGPPTADMARTALIWQAILGCPVTAKQVALCMIGVKISREVNAPKEDNRIDGIGYWLCSDRIEKNV